jgi:hypothetical protein
VDIEGTGPNNSFYSDHKVYTWEIGGSQPITNAVQTFPGTWYVTGSGNLVDDNGVGTVNKVHWYRRLKTASAPMSVRLAGNKMIVGSAGAPKTIDGALYLVQQQTVGTSVGNPVASRGDETGIDVPLVQWTTDHVSPFFERIDNSKQSQMSGPMKPAYAKPKMERWSIQFYFD